MKRANEYISIFSGGTAADTKRSANQRINQQSFIKQGQTKAVIKIHLFNGGSDAYKRDEWGNEIVFEKVLYEKSSHLHIKGASGKEVRNTQDLKDRSNLFEFQNKNHINSSKFFYANMQIFIIDFNKQTIRTFIGAL